MTSYKDWNYAQLSAVRYAFDAWAENQYDDMKAGGGQTEEDIERFDAIAVKLDNVDVPDLDATELEAVENAAWVLLDTSGLLPGESVDDWVDNDDFDIDDLRAAARLAGWTERWQQTD